MASLRVENLGKNLLETAVLDGVCLNVRAGEILGVTGPSGAGKTTLLRCVAGQFPVDAGQVWVGAREVTAEAAHRRGIGAVWQDGALWPHLNVRENVAFALEQLRVPEEEVRRVVHEVLSVVGLDSVGERRPGELSAGQRQRAALARALAIGPAVLLLDEPFTALDARGREEMFLLVRQQCAEHGLAVLWTTRNTRELLARADRVAVLAAGKILQEDSPLALWRRPRSRFVAEWVGGANVLSGTVVQAGAGEFVATTALGEISGALVNPEREPEPGAPIEVVLRPEALRLDLFAPEENAFAGTVTAVTFFGGAAEVVFQTVQGERLRVMELNPRSTNPAGVTAAGFVWIAPEDVVGVA